MWQHVFVCLLEDFHLTYGPFCHPCLGSGSTPCTCRLKIPIGVPALRPLLDCLRRGVGNMPSENSCSKIPTQIPFLPSNWGRRHKSSTPGPGFQPPSQPHSPPYRPVPEPEPCFPQQLEAEPKPKSDPRPASHAELQFPLLSSCFYAVS